MQQSTSYINSATPVTYSNSQHVGGEPSSNQLHLNQQHPTYVASSTGGELSSGAQQYVSSSGQSVTTTTTTQYAPTMTENRQSNTYVTTTGGAPSVNETTGGASVHGGVTYSTAGQSQYVSSSNVPSYVTTGNTTNQYVQGSSAQTGYVVSSSNQRYANQTTTTTTTNNSSVNGQGSGVVSREVSGATYSGGSNTVYGQQRIISVTEKVDESRSYVISERFQEHEIKVPKRIIREEVIERVIVVPETVTVEEIVDDTAIVRERIVEVAKPTIVEKVIEVPEIEYVERIVEVPEKIVQEKIREVEKVQYQERIVEVPKMIPRERVVEIPEIQYRDVVVEKIVEVPDYREEIVYKEVPIPQYVEVPVPHTVNVEVPVVLERNVPIPVEAEVTYEYRLPQLKPRYTKATYPVYLPRFIEVPVATELLSSGLLSSANAFLAQVEALSKSAASLCEIENLAINIMKTDFQAQLSSADLQTAVTRAWQNGSLSLGAGQGGSSTMMLNGVGMTNTSNQTLTQSTQNATNINPISSTMVTNTGISGSYTMPAPSSMIQPSSSAFTATSSAHQAASSSYPAGTTTSYNINTNYPTASPGYTTSQYPAKMTSITTLSSSRVVDNTNIQKSNAGSHLSGTIGGNSGANMGFSGGDNNQATSITVN